MPLQCRDTLLSVYSCVTKDLFTGYDRPVYAIPGLRIPLQSILSPNTQILVMYLPQMIFICGRIETDCCGRIFMP